MNEKTRLIDARGKLIVTVVDRDHGERAVALTKESGARGGTILLGRTSSVNRILDFLAIGEIDNDIVLTIAEDDQVDPIMTSLGAFKAQGKHRAGFVVLVDVRNILKHVLPGQARASTPSDRRPKMRDNADSSLIMFIVNRGYADDVMAAARKAGATGGTILNARGTGKEEDVKFFGIALVPEKEILLIVAENSRSDAVMEAIKTIPELTRAGAGVAVRIEAEEFFLLGKNPE
jgi:nitrogen regulatory protein PII